MNPSASGWIKKLLLEQPKIKTLGTWENLKFYNALQQCGFIYGANINTVIAVKTTHKLTQEETSKVNLCIALLATVQKHRPYQKQEQNIQSILYFYKTLSALKLSTIDRFLIGNNPIAQLEKVLHSRIKGIRNFFTKNFSSSITSALLYTDIIAFTAFLKQEKDITNYAKTVELRISAMVLQALEAKKEKSEIDHLLIHLVESSLGYHQYAYTDTLQDIIEPIEKWYILDLSCMSIWNDLRIDPCEKAYITSLATTLNLKPKTINTAQYTIVSFLTNHKKEIAFFNHTNPVKHFYDQSLKAVQILIKRNKKRLLQEIQESKELMQLLSKSTMTELSMEERKKMKQQLLDVCKTIPSLAIFALPGGSVLLPIFVKFVPNLLPSAFNDNKIEKENATKK